MTALVNMIDVERQCCRFEEWGEDRLMEVLCAEAEQCGEANVSEGSYVASGFSRTVIGTPAF